MKRIVLAGLVLTVGSVGCARPSDNLCPASIVTRLDTAAAVSAWGGDTTIAIAGLNEIAAECVPVRFVDGPKAGAIRSYRIPVSVMVRAGIIDTSRYNIVTARTGLSGVIRLDALAKSGVVLETATEPYQFVDTKTGQQVSGAVLVSADEMPRVASVRASWVFTR